MLYNPSGQHGPYAQFPAHGLGINVFSLISKGGIARDYANTRQLGETVDQSLSDAVAQIIGMGVRADIGKREYRQGINCLAAAPKNSEPCSHGKQRRQCNSTEHQNGAILPPRRSL